MTKKQLQDIPLIKLVDEDESKFVRKMVVIAYTLKKVSPSVFVPYYLMTVIVPKQSDSVISDFEGAKSYSLPRGYSLIKGTREMIYRGEQRDISKGFESYFTQLFKGRLKTRHIDHRVDGTLPVIISALTEAREEAGLKPKHIQQMISLGIHPLFSPKGTLNVDCYAIELKKPILKKAVDSLQVNYFTMNSLQRGAATRVQFNIPLIRPHHVVLIEKLYKPLKKYYASHQIQLKQNDKNLDVATLIKSSKKAFQKLLKDARAGNFKAQKCSKEETIKNLIKRSAESLKKKNFSPKT